MAAPTTEQVPLGAPVDTSVVHSSNHVKETSTTPAIAPEDVAATTVVEPLKDEVNPLPTVTHAEAGTAHKETDPATTVSGVQADKPVDATTESVETKKADETTGTPVLKADETPKEASPKKETPKEKTEKVKAEGKGFFAKLFGSKDKSPKKPKVKTPKVEKTDPIATTATEPVAGSSTDATLVTKTEATTEPVVVPEAAKETEAPVAPPKDTIVGSAPEETKETEILPVVPETKAIELTTETAASTSTSPAIASTEAESSKTAAEPKAAEHPKNPKVSRRLSARLGGFMKTLVPKKEHHEEHKEHAHTEASKEGIAVSEEAPKIEKPEPIAPLLEEPKPAAATVASTSTPAAATAPVATPVVATAA